MTEPRGGGRGRDFGLRRTLGRMQARRARVDPFADAERPNEAFEATWRSRVRRRVLVVVATLSCWAVGVEARLVQLQVVEHADLTARATHQQHQLVTVPAIRGDIVDRNGQILAYSVDADAVIADPHVITDPEGTTAALCEVLDGCDAAERAQVLARLSNSKSEFAYVRRFVTPAAAARVTALDLTGVGLQAETRRFYPNNELAAHVLGFVGTENTGLAGVEATYDSTVSGQNGVVLVEQDAHGRALDSVVERPPTMGATLELTIDEYLQHIAERELAAGVREYDAVGGSAVIMDPWKGQILALASFPGFNPNVFGRYSADDRRDRAIQDIYEPGSTFKIVTASAALQEGVVTPQTLIDTNPGYIKIGSRPPVYDDEHHNNGVLPFEDVIVKSSNVGAIKVGLQVGPERFMSYLHRFGFGQDLLPDLSGGSNGIVYPLDKISDSALASMSMGYQVGVTPVQMAAAVSAVANGGTLYEPRLVRAVIRDGVRTPVADTVVRHPITPETAATLTSIMEDVVLRGTGRKAQLDGYRVAGKTGTAAKIVDGRYSTVDYNVSFVGFVPSRHPVLAIVVVIDTPRKGPAYGGEVAAPIFKNIAAAALQQMGVPRTIDPTPPILMNAPPTLWAAAPPTAIIPTPVSLGGRAVVPDVRGLSARAALRVLGAAGLSMQLDGDGLVVDQTPAPGSPLERGAWGVLHLRRDAAAAPAAGGDPR